MAKKAINNGKIVHMDFSFHDNYDMFKEVIDVITSGSSADAV